MENNVRIDRGTAEKEFQRLCDSWHVDSGNVDETLVEAIIDNLVSGILQVKEQEGDGMRLTVIHQLCEKGR